MRQTLELALEALNTTESDCGSRAWEREQEAIDAIKEALAQPEQWGASAVTHPEYIAEQKAKTQELRSMLAQPEQEPVALKLGECWPENVMQMWDYYRKEIANGNTGSEPRDWFESLSEMRLVDTIPPQRTWVGLTDEEITTTSKETHFEPKPVTAFARAIEAKLKEKNT